MAMPDILEKMGKRNSSLLGRRGTVKSQRQKKKKVEKEEKEEEETGRGGGGRRRRRRRRRRRKTFTHTNFLHQCLTLFVVAQFLNCVYCL